MHRIVPHYKELPNPMSKVSGLRIHALEVSPLPCGKDWKIPKLTDDCFQPTTPPIFSGLEVHSETYLLVLQHSGFLSRSLFLLTWASREIGRGQARSPRVKWNTIRLRSTSNLGLNGKQNVPSGDGVKGRGSRRREVIKRTHLKILIKDVGGLTMLQKQG